MEQRSFGFINIDNSNKKGIFLNPIYKYNRSAKKLKGLLNDDFSHLQHSNFRQIDQSSRVGFSPHNLQEMVNKAKLRFIETSPNYIIRGQEIQTVPFYVKQRDDQLKKVKSFKSSFRKQTQKEDDVNQKVCIYLAQAFFVILLVLIATELVLRKQLY
ncbi:unnamed protein product (macronuclear) [Paramecium tetraurelia]|uniref:Transmembrane protein n=1 Tax=Paramecium tetraurelia TaxID=5888 RepID=A0BMG9_PARTE|nr:uncharacterized protein GSPATT00030372001 [Paramecium tetraurelia]CAK59736.1 unnamed protein product [Paramecium tetraurelia]|eukprot:XP_001427134.1 hypothetical protein (macronuclear) [Paramecium tetraurelia strain d4-2]